VDPIRTIIGEISDMKKEERFQRYEMDQRNKQDEKKKIPPGAWTIECCQVEDSCVWLITRPEESYRL
jgi:hypothetical protein